MTDDLRGTLDRVGDRFNLGEYEIDAYLAVLEHGELTASDIADRTDIPQPRVYDTRSESFGPGSSSSANRGR